MAVLRLIEGEQSTTKAPAELRLVWFSERDCLPCRRHGEVLRRLSPALGTGTIACIDVTAHPEAIAEHDLIVLPTTLVEVDGQEVIRFAGTPDDARILQFVARAAPDG
jgi:thioredoxin-like negative regulator of GroEL